MSSRSTIITLLLFSVVLSETLWSWGREGHRMINLNGIRSLPSSMQRFRDVDFYFADHASDIERKRTRDSDAPYREFIQLERYPEVFVNRMPGTLIELQKKYGKETVRLNGILPYHVMELTDSLRRIMRQGNWAATVTLTAELGYYVAELAMPLRNTMNFDGQYTHNNGIKWRFEEEFMERYSGKMFLKRNEPQKFGNVSTDMFSKVFTLSLRSHSKLPVILRADTMAFRLGKNTFGGKYYSSLWSETGKMMNELVQESVDLYASLVYNAWSAAGGSTIVWQDDVTRKGQITNSEPEHLEQNYPNPFNPKTTIAYRLTENVFAKLSVFNLFGQELDVLFEGRQGPGTFEFVFTAEHLPEGVYFARLQMNDRVEARKMIYAK
ncbi:MAG: T9SS type A sorting domain-containing protein [Bacteroidetes bacterium]|nr:T9SS type A sorting domain-containing protein [Bacteroidota bacterium]